MLRGLVDLSQKTGPERWISPGTPTDWLYSDWLLIAHTLKNTQHDDYRCYECDTVDALLWDIAHYWNLDERELTEAIA